MELSRRHLVATLGTVAVAGCTGTPSESAGENSDSSTTTATSETTTTTTTTGRLGEIQRDVSDDEELPGFTVSYDIDDYAELLLEGPDGEIIREERISPSSSEIHLAFSNPSGGEYKAVLLHGDETIDTLTRSFESPNLVIENIEDSWRQSTLESVAITFKNSGGLWIRIRQFGVSLGPDERTNTTSGYLYPGEPYTHEFEAGLSVDEPGTVEGSVFVETPQETTSESFSRHFDGPALEVVAVDDRWSGRTLNEVNVTIENTGDMETSVNGTVSHEGEQLMRSIQNPIQPGERVTWSFGEIRLHRYDGSGTARYSVEFESEYASAETSFEKSFE